MSNRYSCLIILFCLFFVWFEFSCTKTRRKDCLKTIITPKMNLAKEINKALPNSEIVVLAGNYKVYPEEPIKIKRGIKLSFNPNCKIFSSLNTKVSLTNFFVIFELFARKGNPISDISIIGNGLEVYGLGISPILYNWGMSIDINTNASECKNIFIKGIKFYNFGYAGVQLGGSSLEANSLDNFLTILSIEKRKLSEVLKVKVKASGHHQLGTYGNSPKIIRINDGLYDVKSVEKIDQYIWILDLERSEYYRKLGNNHSININDTVFFAAIPENILIEDIECNNNFQHGCALTQGRNITFKNCKFNNTVGLDGVDTGFGMDIEPNRLNQISGIRIFNCSFNNNKRHGLYIHRAEGIIALVDSIVGSIFSNNKHNGVSITQQTNNDLYINQCLIENNLGSGIWLEGNLIEFSSNSIKGNKNFGAYIKGRDLKLDHISSYNNRHNLQLELIADDIENYIKYKSKESRVYIDSSHFKNYFESPNVGIYGLRLDINNSLFELKNHYDIIFNEIKPNSSIKGCIYSNKSSDLKVIKPFKTDKSLNKISFEKNTYLNVKQDIEK